MASPATARRTEPLHDNHDADSGVHTPLRAAHHTPARTPTPRPSISPLSTASKAPRGSPIATRDATMRDVELDQISAEALDAADRPEAEIGDIPDDRSSSLSEPEDVDDDEEGLRYVANGARGVTLPTAQKNLEVDSEAETERLEESPRKSRQHADSTGRTPSKLSKAAGVEDDLSEPPSPLPTGPGAASSTSTIETAGQKRKRSDAEDSPLTSEESDIEQSPRKRSQGPSTHPLEGEVAESTEPNGADDAQEIEETEIAEVEDVEVPTALPTKGFKGKRGRKPGRKPKAQEETEEVETADATAGIEGDETAEPEPKSEEELKQKGEASSSFEDLAKQFTAFRQRLVNESLASVEHELQLLNQPDCIHPEFLRQVSCIDERRAKQIREANAFYRFRM